MNSVTKLDSIEAYDGEVYYKKSFLLNDDQKNGLLKIETSSQKKSMQ